MVALRTLALIGLLGPCACAPDPPVHRNWEPVSEEEVRTAIAEPTGTLILSQEAEVVRLAAERMPGLLETARFMGRTMHVMSEVANADLSSKEDEVPDAETGPESSEDSTWGTSLYARVACPRDFTNPVTDFTAGSVRIDSPRINGLEFLPLLEGGDLLLSFDACEFGGTTVDATIPGRYVVDLERIGFGAPADPEDQPAFAVALDFAAAEFEGVESPISLAAFGCGGQLSCLEDFRAAAVLDAGDEGTFVMKFRVFNSYFIDRTDLTVEIVGENGSSTCTYVSVSGYPNLFCESQ